MSRPGGDRPGRQSGGPGGSPGDTQVPGPSPGSQDAARRWLEQGCPPGVPARPAARVCLLRPAAGPRHDAADVEVLWIERSASLAFAPGALAFPGGAIEDDDSGPAAAAARELVEETGLATDPAGLVALARWVTPAHEPRRYDTVFLAGLCHQERADPRPDGAEIAAAGWAPPSRLLADVAEGRRWALAPTLALLSRLRLLRVDGAGAAGTGANGTGADRTGTDGTGTDGTSVDGTGADRTERASRLAASLADLAATADLRPVEPVATWREAPGGDVVLRLPGHAEGP